MKRKDIICPTCGTHTFNNVGRCKCGYKFPYDPIQDELIVDLCTNCREIKIYKNGYHIGGAPTVCPICNNGILTPMGTVDEWNKMSQIEKEKYINMVAHETINKNNSKPTIKCPYCNSVDTTKISTTSKIVNTAIFGFFGTKRHKQWHCNQCNSDF